MYDIETSFNVLIITRVMSTLKDFIPGKNVKMVFILTSFLFVDIQFYEAKGDYDKAIEVCDKGILTLDHWRLYHLKLGWRNKQRYSADKFSH